MLQPRKPRQPKEGERAPDIAEALLNRATRMVQLRRFGGPERLEMIDEPLPRRDELVLVAPSDRMMECGQGNHVSMTWQRGIVVGRNVVNALVRQRRILRDGDVAMA